MINYLPSLMGGALIGLSSTLFLLLLGRVAGISGLFSNILKRPSLDNSLSLSFIGGLIIGGLSLYWYRPQFFEYKFSMNLYQCAIAGILVGFGTRIGSGCTSGHGVCGIARFSKRSLVATVLFMAAGILTTFIRRQFWGL